MAHHSSGNQYNFSNRKRGTAIIINNVNFKPGTYQEVRSGAKMDSDNLEATFELLGFTIKSFTDLTTMELLSVLQAEAEADHTTDDCFVCAISTHGDQDIVRENRWSSKAEQKDIIYAIDGIIYLNLITRMFTQAKCPTLAGKPKLFFIQACRGDDLAISASTGPQTLHEDGEDTVDLGRQTCIVNEIPIFKDFVLAYSAPPGFYSFRRGTGSWFITALCNIFQTCHKDDDLMSMLTKISNQVVFDYESNTPRNKRTHRRHIVPWIASMLTKDIYFTPKTAENERLTFV